jgi:hypothetical protein
MGAIVEPGKRERKRYSLGLLAGGFAGVRLVGCSASVAFPDELRRLAELG